MSADLLREAAAKMRERAEAADATGSWDWRSEDGATYWAEMTRSGGYIQSWHPAVALAVADWLDACAEFVESEPGFTWDGEDHALNIARAYLGRDA